MNLSPVQTEYRAAVQRKLDDGTYTLEEVACLCGADDDVEIADRDRFGLPVHVQLCRACGLARTSPRLSMANLGHFYEHDYHGLHLSIRKPDPDAVLFHRDDGAIHAFMADLIPSGSLRVVDVGCGTGHDLRSLTARLNQPVTAVGCEYALSFVEAGRRAGSDIRHGGPEALADEQPFDLVILSHVVEHFPDPVADLAAVRALGHERTLFYVEVPGLLSIDSKPEYAYTLDQYLTLAHTFHFTRATLAATMGRAAFAEVRADEQVHSVFKHGPVMTPEPDPAEARATLASLERLGSLSMTIRRLRPRARQMVTTAAKTMLPERAVAALRRH